MDNYSALGYAFEALKNLDYTEGQSGKWKTKCIFI